MARQLVGVAGVALLSLVMAACSSTPIDPSNQQGASEAELGSVNLPLTAKVGDTAYRLRLATFTITGTALAAPRVVKPPADEAIHTEALPVGNYSILLANGWVLEKMGPESKVFAAVEAKLVTPNPLTFSVDGKVPGDAFFGFVTASGDVSLGQGSANIRIGVADCAAYDTYTASLGALTADCRGTVDPRDYQVNADGFLVPTFDSCPADRTQLVMRQIRQLLSLQYRTARLPFAKQCMAGRYDAYLQKFASMGVEVCPLWVKAEVLNPITDQVVDGIIKGLPELPNRAGELSPDVSEALKVNSMYRVGFDNQPAQKCATPAECAQLCAGAFPGFVLSGEGESVLTDPVAWLLETTYASASLDPYLRAGYYHPMSYYGPLPGVQFAEYNRFDPCGGNICQPETCSYYAGIHLKAQLQKDCLDPANLDTCVSYCGPKP
jgi:hypothetical protein